MSEYVPGTYFLPPVCTYYIFFFPYVPVCTWYILEEFSAFFCMYILTLSQYILGVPDSIVRLPGPASLHPSDSGSSPRIASEPNHTKALAGLFTAAWQQPCLHAWARVRAACWRIQLLLVSFTRLAAIMISCLLTSSPSPSQRCSARCEWACEGLGFQVGAPMMNCKIFMESCQVQRFNQRDETKS